MNNKHTVLAATRYYLLSNKSRRFLLQKFPFKYSVHYAHHITWKSDPYNEEMTGKDAPNPQNVEVIGYLSDESLECLVVRFNNQNRRLDGGFYHITWSLDPPRRPEDSNNLLLKDFRRIRKVKPIKILVSMPRKL